MNPTTLLKVAKLAEEVSSESKDPYDYLVSASLFSLCAAIAAGEDTLLAFTYITREFTGALSNAIDYQEWVEKA